MLVVLLFLGALHPYLLPEEHTDCAGVEATPKIIPLWIFSQYSAAQLKVFEPMQVV
jgi:hypothetical protein